jgi:uncharacterized protein
MRRRTRRRTPERAAGPGRGGNDRTFLLPLLATLVLLLGTLLVGGPAEAQILSDDSQSYLDVEVATIGMDLRTGAPLAILHADWEQVVPIWIGEVEAQAIARAREGIELPRPQTHDLLASLVQMLGATVEEVRIHDLRDNTYFGVVRVRVNGELREIDSRPSDGLALAVRTGARIRVATRLVEEFPDVEFISAEGDRAIARIRGLTVSTPSPSDRERFGLDSFARGVLVLHSDTQVGARGARQGDLVLAVDGLEVETAADFLDALVGRSPDTSIGMRVIRDGEVREIEVPGRRPPGRVS